MKFDARKYTYSIAPSSRSPAEFEARCLEIPDVVTIGRTPAAALELCVEHARKTVKAMKDPPEPFSTRSYKGHIAVRVPPSLHRELVDEAKRQGVSLNALINRKLAVLARV